ncbi:MAG: zinc ribbon domain-containing protein, partial [Tannerella sp.]|nr:zinc ribbon domain-containing protein [Tannerella sp.]
SEENVSVDQKDAEANKLMAILAYLGILVLVPILAAKESPFARFHANQGLLLLLTSIVGGIVVGILATILAFVSVVLAGALYSVFYLAILALAIIGIINAVKGEKKELPVIGKLFTLIK